MECDAGWKVASGDISIRGLGWVSITGVGLAELEVRMPKGVGVTFREDSLLPMDIWDYTGKWSGGRMIKKTTRGGQKGNHGGGRRPLGDRRR